MYIYIYYDLEEGSPSSAVIYSGNLLQKVYYQNICLNKSYIMILLGCF